MRGEGDDGAEEAGLGAKYLLDTPPDSERDSNRTGDVCNLSLIHLLPTFSRNLLRPDSSASGPTDSDNELTN